MGFFFCYLKLNIFERKIVNLFVFVCFPLFPFLFMEYLNILMIMMGFGLLTALCLISKKIEELTKLTV